jgi:hypothetical protein
VSSPTKDETGNVYTRLTVIRYAGRDKRGPLWLCRCTCGTEVVVPGQRLRAGKKKSCRCLERENNTPRGPRRGHRATFISWLKMKQRCADKKRRNYGAKGITICDRWLGVGGFEHFLADMGPRPKGMTIDRWPNKHGNYEPTNCRWATPAQQGQNTRVNKLDWDKVRAMRERWSKEGVSKETLAQEFNVKVNTVTEVLRNRAWIDPAYIRDNTARLARAVEENRDRSRKLWQDPEFRQKHRERMRSPETRRKLAELAEARVTHGHTRKNKRTPEYRCWKYIRQVCTNPKHPKYKYAGARGIRVAPEWQNDFAIFLAHVGLRPGPQYSLARINLDKNFESGNVRWMTVTELIRRRVVRLTIEKAREIRTQAAAGRAHREIALEFGIRPSHVSAVTCNHVWKEAA